MSNASWHYGLPTNRQQLPARLAKHTRVLYSSPFSLSQALLGHVRLRDYQPRLREVQPNLYLFDSIRVLPMVRGQIWPVSSFDKWVAVRLLRRHIEDLEFAPPILWGYFPPSFRQLIGQLGEVLTCYHCTDNHVGHAEAHGRDPEPVAKAEAQLVRDVDVVFATSRPLFEEKRQQNPNTYLMPNVADVAHFHPVSAGSISVAPEVRNFRGAVAGFVGAVDAYKVDLSLIQEVSLRLPEWSFVFVGPVGSGDATSRADLPVAPNLHFLGRRSYERLPNYVAGFDVCIIPYSMNQYTSGVFPLKFWEYLASGRPVVTTPLPALQEYYDFVEVAEDAPSFVAALKRAHATAYDEAACAARVQLASRQSWDRRAADILKVLYSHL